MELASAFISQPCNAFVVSRRGCLCMEAAPSRYHQQRSRRVVSMSLDSGSNDLDLSSQADVTLNQERLETPEFVEIGDGDIEAEDIDVMDALGTEFKVVKEKRKKTRKRTTSVLEEITVQRDSGWTSDADNQPPIEEDELAEIVRTTVRAADQRKAEDIVALRVSKLTFISSFVIIATGKNSPQIRAIGNVVEEDLAKNHGLHARRKDGTSHSGWLLLDYGDLLVNVFTPEQRKLYNLEGLWKKGEKLDVSDCIAGPGERRVQDELESSLDDWLDE